MPYADPAKEREYKRAYRAANREKINAAMRQYRLDHPVRSMSPEARERQRQTSRAYEQATGAVRRLRRNHGMLPEDWVAMRASQNGRCYLCGDELPDDLQKIHIDHDHTCCPPNKSCSACRRGMACHVIGMARDDVDRLRRIADALEQTHAEVRPRIAAKFVQAELPLEAAS